MATSADSVILQEIGTDIVRGFISVVIETFNFAIYTVLVIKAAQVLSRKAYTRASLITLTAVIVMYMIALILWVIDLTNFVSEPRNTLINNPNDPLDGKYADALNSIFHLSAVEDALYAYMSLIGDAIIIWRVHAFWGYGKHRWVLLLPSAILFGSTIASLLLTYCVGHLGTEIVLGEFKKPAFCRNIQTTTYSMAMGTTAFATALIGIKTWTYRRWIKPMIHGSRRVTQVEKVMTLLLESGVLYLLFFLIQVLGNDPVIGGAIDASYGWSLAFMIYSFSSSIIVGMYPTIIIILAHSTRAVLDNAAASNISSWQAAPGTSTATRSTLWESSQVGRTTRLTGDIELYNSTNGDEGKDAKPTLPL